MTIRVSVANIKPREFAEAIQAEGFSARVVANFGAGSWGVEEGATATFAGIDTAQAAAIRSFVRELLNKRKEEAALIEQAYNETASLLWNTGRMDLLA